MPLHRCVEQVEYFLVETYYFVVAKEQVERYTDFLVMQVALDRDLVSHRGEDHVVKWAQTREGDFGHD